MVSMTCDVCGREKPQPEASVQEEWLLGWDLQTQTDSAVTRSIRFLDRWDDRRAIELGAIHLCSLECRDDYVRGKRAA